MPLLSAPELHDLLQQFSTLELSGVNALEEDGSTATITLTGNVRSGGQAAVRQCWVGSERSLYAARLTSAAGLFGRRQALQLRLANVKRENSADFPALLPHRAIFSTSISPDWLTSSFPVVVEVSAWCETDLKTRLTATGPLAIDDFIVKAIPLVRTIDSLHAMKVPVVHRDIAPDNVLIDNNGALRLIDFGYSAVGGNEMAEVTATLCFKQGRVPPEILSIVNGGADGRVTVRNTVDIWLLGRLLFDMLAGFVQGREIQPSLDHLNRIPRDLARAILAMMDVKPESRPSLGVILRTLERLQAATAPPSVQDPPPRNRSGLHRRPPFQLVAMGYDPSEVDSHIAKLDRSLRERLNASRSKPNPEPRLGGSVERGEQIIQEAQELARSIRRDAEEYAERRRYDTSRADPALQGDTKEAEELRTARREIEALGIRIIKAHEPITPENVDIRVQDQVATAQGVARRVRSDAEALVAARDAGEVIDMNNLPAPTTELARAAKQIEVLMRKVLEVYANLPESAIDPRVLEVCALATQVSRQTVNDAESEAVRMLQS